ncbi:MerR family transcriptional regulator [uncultured Photobacterium sp.]|uniref:MerR family transcriptional regulator n=1 Tax=uncultured Photobacterium sp. TaxID=173973 RepID=UPI002603E931|nr:MerR family transcriptional regulator [uncultured Photobacterium sp.]
MGCEVQYYPIKDVSEMTGVNAVTLRAWQRRYGLLNPKRTEKGHRLYSDNDIEKIRKILSWLEKGVAIGKVRPLIDGSLLASEIDNQASENQKTVALLMAALADCNRSKLDQQLIQIMKEYPVDVFIDQVVNAVEKEVNNPENPIANIQHSLWQSVITERCIAIISQMRKQATKLCFLLSFEQQTNYRLWLKAWILTNKGYGVTVMPVLEGKLSALIAAIAKQKTDKVVVFGDHNIVAANLTQLEVLARSLNCECEFDGDITEIHADFKGSYNL